MIILGIDPGTARVGWGVIQTSPGHVVSATAFGCITTAAKMDLSDRLVAIHSSITKLIKQYHPDAVAVEDLFFSTNVKTAMSVSQARGVIILSAAQQQIPVLSYTPLVVKLTICGNGRADKAQVTHMIVRQLHLTAAPTPDDTADALAIALTHAYRQPLASKI